MPNSLVEAACFVNPNTITGSGQVTLTVNTTPPHALVHPRVRMLSFRTVGGAALGLLALGLAVLTLWIPRRKWRVPAMLGIVALAILSLATGCGSSGASDPGTPTGASNIVVTGTSGSGSSQILHTVVVPVTIE